MTPEIIPLRQAVFVGPARITVLAMRPATPADRAAIDMAASPQEAGIEFAAHLCGVPAYTIRSLDVLDGARVAEALNRQMLGIARR